jgi:5-methylcytosine-specific restriction endonuclease McrA
MATKREQIFNKFNGLCAYSGIPLEADWQIDHIKPKIMYQIGSYPYEGNPNNIDNLVPCQRIINHYKRALPIDTFRTWFLGELHLRLKKLPKNPKVNKSIKHKEYLLKVASYFDITVDKPFSGIFYFEKINIIKSTDN